ncbi:hypothetical protein ACFFOP_08060 [Sinosporangium siamense]
MIDEQRGLLKDFWGPGMRADPADREAAGPLTPAPGDRLLTSPAANSWSAWVAPGRVPPWLIAMTGLLRTRRSF